MIAPSIRIRLRIGAPRMVRATLTTIRQRLTSDVSKAVKTFVPSRAVTWSTRPDAMPAAGSAKDGGATFPMNSSCDFDRATTRSLPSRIETIQSFGILAPDRNSRIASGAIAMFMA